MNYTLEINHDILHISFKGDLLGGTESLGFFEDLNKALASGLSKAIIDMTNVRYTNSNGLGILISIYTKFKNKAGNVVIYNANEQVVKLMSITKLDSVIKMYKDLKTAQEAV
jgi:anti-sigma B factor antagonist